MGFEEKGETGLGPDCSVKSQTIALFQTPSLSLSGRRLGLAILTGDTAEVTHIANVDAWD